MGWDWTVLDGVPIDAVRWDGMGEGAVECHGRGWDKTGVSYDGVRCHAMGLLDRMGFPGIRWDGRSLGEMSCFEMGPYGIRTPWYICHAMPWNCDAVASVRCKIFRAHREGSAWDARRGDAIMRLLGRKRRGWRRGHKWGQR